MNNVSRCGIWITLVLSLSGCHSGFAPDAPPSVDGQGAPPSAGGDGGSYAAPRNNLLDNPGVESGLNKWEDWGFSTLSNSAHSGASALKIVGGSGGAGQEVIYRLKTGGTYQLRAFARLSNPRDLVFLAVSFFDVSNVKLGEKRVQVTSNNYTEYAVQFVLPTGVSSAKVNVTKTANGSSTAEFDDFSLVQTAAPPSPVSKPAIPNPNNLQPNDPRGGNWFLVFAEEFSANILDRWVWNSGFWFNYNLNNELQAYRPENVYVSNGNLKLMAEKRNTATTWGEPMSYASGAINTRNKLSFTFGMIEARMRMPTGRGLGAAFWLLPSNKRSPPQMNLLNVYGNDPSTARFNYMWLDDFGTPHAQPMAISGPNLAQGYHTYALEWSPDVLNWLVDGNIVGTFRGDFVLRDPAFLILNLAVGGEAGVPDSTTPFPQAMTVDYVRIWQKPY